MAPVVEPTLIEIYPWPVLTCVIDGQPAIGAQLYSYVPATSTPKSTFADPFFVTPNPNPVVLDDQGKATVFLDGLYDLRLFDEDDVLIWSVDAYTFSSGVVPSPGLVQVGSAQATLDAVDGAAVLTATGLAPAGYRLIGCTTEITEDFGTSRGLTSLLIGDAVLDRWGDQATLTVGTVHREQHFHSDTEICTTTPYELRVAAAGGLFDGSGQLTARIYWQFLGTTEPPGTNPAMVEYGSAEAILTASDGASVLTAAGLAPADARILGLTTEITAEFGISRGLTGLILGDGVVSDRFGVSGSLTPETTTNQLDFNSDVQQIAPPGYTILVSALGGTFDANGSVKITLYWSTLMPV